MEVSFKVFHKEMYRGTWKPQQRQSRDKGMDALVEEESVRREPC